MAIECEDRGDYEYCRVTGTETIDVQSQYGGVMENVLIDQSGHGNMAMIDASGDFVIRNVGIEGQCTGGSESKQIQPVVEDPNGEGLIENVYMPGSGGDQDIMGMYSKLEHAGTVTVRNVFITEYDDNGMYVSVPGSIHHTEPSAGGVFQIENCYALNNNISNFRIGSDGSYVEDSVVVVDESVGGGPHAHPNGLNPRGIWFRNNADVTARNCEVWMNHSRGDFAVGVADSGTGARIVDSLVFGGIGGGVETINTTDGSLDQIPPVPAGVPTSPEMAASGGSGGGNGGDSPYTLDPSPNPSSPQGTVFEVIAHSGSGNVDYTFDVEGGDAWRWNAGGDPPSSSIGETNVSATISEEGVITVSGRTGNGYGDAFDIGGTVTAFDAGGMGGSVDLFWGGEPVSASDLPLEQPPTCADLTCGPCETCVELSPSGAECQPVDNPCCDVECDPGEECIDGECIPTEGPCGDLTCGECQTCVELSPTEAECQPVDNPCCGVECGEGLVCRDGDCVPVDDGGGGISAALVFGAAVAGGWIVYQSQRRDDSR